MLRDVIYSTSGVPGLITDQIHAKLLTSSSKHSPPTSPCVMLLPYESQFDWGIPPLDDIFWGGGRARLSMTDLEDNARSLWACFLCCKAAYASRCNTRYHTREYHVTKTRLHVELKEARRIPPSELKEAHYIPQSFITDLVLVNSLVPNLVMFEINLDVPMRTVYDDSCVYRSNISIDEFLRLRDMCKSACCEISCVIVSNAIYQNEWDQISQVFAWPEFANLRRVELEGSVIQELPPLQTKNLQHLSLDGGPWTYQSTLDRLDLSAFHSLKTLFLKSCGRLNQLNLTGCINLEFVVARDCHILHNAGDEGILLPCGDGGGGGGEVAHKDGFAWYHNVRTHSPRYGATYSGGESVVDYMSLRKPRKGGCALCVKHFGF